MLLSCSCPVPTAGLHCPHRSPGKVPITLVYGQASSCLFALAWGLGRFPAALYLTFAEISALHGMAGSQLWPAWEPAGRSKPASSREHSALCPHPLPGHQGHEGSPLCLACISLVPCSDISDQDSFKPKSHFIGTIHDS